MKRILSLLVVLAMVFSMVPNVFAGTDVDFDELLGKYDRIDDIAQINVSLEEGSLGAKYVWTPAEDGTVTITLYAEDLPEGNEIDYVVSQGDNMAFYSESEDGSVTLEVIAGEDISIEVFETSALAVETVLYGSFLGLPGTEGNPIWPNFVWNEDNTEATATVTAPVGTTYYAVRGAGMELTINDGEATVLPSVGFGQPNIFTVVNEGEAEAEYSLKIAYPAGHQMNPAATELGWVDVSLAADDRDGYYYTYVAEGTGTVTAYISSITEGVEGDIVLYNNNTYVQKSLSADGVDNYGLEVSIDVTEGDILSIQVVAMPDENWAIPAAEITWVGAFAYAAGSEQNPIFPEFTWNEDWTEATATVIAPVGTTYYACYNGGMMLTINDGEPILLVAAGMGRAPAVFSITNDGEAEAEYSLKISYPAGHQMNPEVTYLGWSDVSLAESDFDGHYYTYVAEGTGTVTAYIGSITEGVEGDIVLYNNNTYVQKSLTADGVDNNGMEVSIDVTEGDVLTIQVLALPDASYNYPAADITWVGNFAYPLGSEQNPIFPEFTWNEDWTEATATVIAPVGTTYYACYNSGMLLTINDGEPILLVAAGMGRVPAVFSITNDGEAEAEYSLKIAYPVGNQMNPAELVIGENTASIEAGNSQGYYYSWTASDDGELTITMPEGNWMYVVNNVTASVYGDTQWSDSDPVLQSYTLSVAAGDLIEIIVNTYDPASWSNPAGDLVVTAAFDTSAAIAITKQPASQTVNENGDAVFSVAAAGESALTYQWQFLANEEGAEWKDTTFTGYNTTELTIKALSYRDGYQYRCVITDAEGNVRESAAATLSIIMAEEPVITANPSDVEITAGLNAYFTVEVEGVTSYKWQWRRNETAPWVYTTLPGNSTNSLEVYAVVARSGRQYRCRMVAENGGILYTEAATLTVNASVYVHQNPSRQVAAVNEVGVFSVKAEGPNVTYQWEYRYNADDTNWKNTTLSGYDTPVLNVTAVSGRSGYQYRCAITDENGIKVYSSHATLSVIGFTAQPKDRTAAAGTSATFSVVAVGTGLTYQWQYSRDGGVTWPTTSKPGADTATLTVDNIVAGNNGYQYRCRIKDIDGVVSYSEPGTLTVTAPVKISTQPASQTAADGESVQFSVVATGDIVSYKWEYSRDGGTTWLSTSMPGYDSHTLTVGVIESRNGYMYRCVITDIPGNKTTTEAATLTVE